MCFLRHYHSHTFPHQLLFKRSFICKETLKPGCTKGLPNLLVLEVPGTFSASIGSKSSAPLSHSLSRAGPLMFAAAIHRITLSFTKRGSDLICLNSSAGSSKATKPLLWFCQLSSATLVRAELFLDGSFPRKIQQQASPPSQGSWARCCQRSRISDVVIGRRGLSTDSKGRIPPPESPAQLPPNLEVSWPYIRRGFCPFWHFHLLSVIFHYAGHPWIFLTGARQTVAQSVHLDYEMPKAWHLVPAAGALQSFGVGTLTESLIREIGPTGSPSLDLLQG